MPQRHEPVWGPVSLQAADLEVEALSAGGIETCYQLRALNLMVDIGRCPPGSERHGIVLLTHAHIDHAAGVPYYASLRALLGMAPPRVYIPEPSRHALRTVLDGWSRLQSNADRLELIGVVPGDEVPLGRGFVARAFSSPHRITSTGYTLYSTKKRLRSDLAGLSPEAIAERSRAGEEVNEVQQVPELCFPGDTQIEVVEREPSVRTARALFLECTFLGSRFPVDRASRSGHVHLDQIAERAELFENEQLILTHFSRRFDNGEIRREVEKKLPADLLARTRLVLPHPVNTDSTCSS